MTATAILLILTDANSPAQADPSILYVAPGADCAGTSPCFASVQAAVDGASSGDKIRVAAGTYTDVSVRDNATQVVFISKTVSILGGYTTSNWDTSDPQANLTTLDAQGQGRVLYITGDISPTIEGLRITGGHADYDGGGIFVAGATVAINNNSIFANTANDGGGGVKLGDSSSVLEGNTIISNTGEWGGGLDLWHWSQVKHLSKLSSLAQRFVI